MKILFIQLRTDNTNLTGYICFAGAHIRFTRNIIKINPLTGFFFRNHTFATKNKSVCLIILECFQNCFNLSLRKFMRSF